MLFVIIYSIISDEYLFHARVKLINIKCFMNLSLVSSSISDILGINVANVISPVLHINFVKVHTDSEVVQSINLSFDRMLSLVKRFH